MYSIILTIIFLCCGLCNSLELQETHRYNSDEFLFTKKLECRRDCKKAIAWNQPEFYASGDEFFLTKEQMQGTLQLYNQEKDGRFKEFSWLSNTTDEDWKELSYYLSVKCWDLENNQDCITSNTKMRPVVPKCFCGNNCRISWDYPRRSYTEDGIRYADVSISGEDTKMELGLLYTLKEATGQTEEKINQFFGCHSQRKICDYIIEQSGNDKHEIDKYWYHVIAPNTQARKSDINFIKHMCMGDPWKLKDQKYSEENRASRETNRLLKTAFAIILLTLACIIPSILVVLSLFGAKNIEIDPLTIFTCIAVPSLWIMLMTPSVDYLIRDVLFNNIQWEFI